MNERLLQLAERHGALRARIAAQREALARHTQPVAAAFAVVDRGADGVRWLKQHPGAVASGVAVLTVLRPSRAWRWLKRGFFLWRGWQRLEISLFSKR